MWAVVVLIGLCVVQGGRSLARHTTLQRAHRAANDPRIFNARLSGMDGSIAARIAARLPALQRSELLSVAADLQDYANDAAGDEAARLAGASHFLAANYKLAADAFATIRAQNTADWNDLAAAELAVALQNQRETHLIAALAAADQAIALNPNFVEARFNRALATKMLGASPASAIQWNRYPRHDPWARVARRHATQAKDTRAAWRKHDLSCVSAAELRQLTPQFPQLARLSAESILLSSWAEAMHGNEREAHHQLELARAVAEVLQESGESLVADAVAAIDRAAGTRRLEKLIDGHLAYRDGRLALAKNDAVAAEQHLLRARDLFAAGDSPMAAVAASYAATAIATPNRTAEAHQILSHLRATAVPRHQAHLGRVLHELSNAEGVFGHWSQSIAAVSQSMAVFAARRERGHAAAANVTLSEAYDFVGKPELAWKHGRSALQAACAEGDYDRARVALAALTRTEMRGRRWERARAIARVEEEMIASPDDARLNTGLFLRISAIEHHLGRHDLAAGAVTRARTIAAKLPKGSGEKLLADIDGAEGAMERRARPQKAIALLSSAIAFQQRTERPIVLPELYLERGRAHRSAGNLSAAAADFEHGIRELERQRGRVREAELRPGIFDDSFELFDEAVSLRIRRGENPAAILMDVERGRARAVLEQMQANDPTLVLPGRVEDVQRHLAPDTALVEYVCLPDQIAILVVKGDGVVLRTTNIPRSVVADAVNALLRDLESPAPSLRLYEILLEPIASDLRDVRAVTVVVPDLLQRVPFGALRDRAGVFLVQRQATAIAPSAGTFVATVRRLDRLPRTAPARIAIFANPAIPRDAFPHLPTLHTSEYEARAVGKHYALREVFTRDAATAVRFLETAPSYDVLHYAGHATVNHYEPAESALVCASTPETHGALTLRQIASMQFRSTRAIVLAACSTMDGRNAAVEGVPSLARAFLIAGVPAVVGTLWDIEDSEAAAIVRPLHAQLARGAEPSDALRTAQLAAIRDGLPVRQWAAFALTGAAR